MAKTVTYTVKSVPTKKRKQDWVQVKYSWAEHLCDCVKAMM